MDDGEHVAVDDEGRVLQCVKHAVDLCEVDLGEACFVVANEFVAGVGAAVVHTDKAAEALVGSVVAAVVWFFPCFRWDDGGYEVVGVVGQEVYIFAPCFDEPFFWFQAGDVFAVDVVFFETKVVATFDDGFDEFCAEGGAFFGAPFDVGCAVFLNPVARKFLAIGELNALVQKFVEFLRFFLCFVFHVGMDGSFIENGAHDFIADVADAVALPEAGVEGFGEACEGQEVRKVVGCVVVDVDELFK